MVLNRNIKLLFWFNFFLELKFHAAIIVLYFAEVTGSYALAMSIFATASLSSAFFELPTGIFSDLIGRKRTLVLGAAAHAAAVIFYAMGGRYTALVIGGICEGLSWALFSGNNAALLHDTLAETGQEADYQDFLGRTTAMEHVGVALVGLMGPILAALTSFTVVMWLSVVPQIVLVGIALRFHEPQTHTQRVTNPFAHLRAAWRVLRQNSRLQRLSAASILGFSVGEASYQLRVAFIQGLWPLWGIGIARMMDNVLAAISYYFSGRLIRRFSEFGVLIGGGMASWTVSTFAFALPTAASPAILSITGVLHGVTHVANSGLMQRDFSAEQRATLGSLVALGGSILYAGASVLIGALADQLGLAAILLIAQAVQVIPLWLRWRVFRLAQRGVFEVVIAPEL